MSWLFFVKLCVIFLLWLRMHFKFINQRFIVETDDLVLIYSNIGLSLMTFFYKKLRRIRFWIKAESFSLYKQSLLSVPTFLEKPALRKVVNSLVSAYFIKLDLIDRTRTHLHTLTLSILHSNLYIIHTYYHVHTFSQHLHIPFYHIHSKFYTLAHTYTHSTLSPWQIYTHSQQHLHIHNIHMQHLLTSTNKIRPKSRPSHCSCEFAWLERFSLVVY